MLRMVSLWTVFMLAFSLSALAQETPGNVSGKETYTSSSYYTGPGGPSVTKDIDSTSYQRRVYSRPVQPSHHDDGQAEVSSSQGARDYTYPPLEPAHFATLPNYPNTFRDNFITPTPKHNRSQTVSAPALTAYVVQTSPLQNIWPQAPSSQAITGRLVPGQNPKDWLVQTSDGNLYLLSNARQMEAVLGALLARHAQNVTFTGYFKKQWFFSGDYPKFEVRTLTYSPSGNRML